MKDMLRQGPTLNITRQTPTYMKAGLKVLKPATFVAGYNQLDQISTLDSSIRLASSNGASALDDMDKLMKELQGDVNRNRNSKAAQIATAQQMMNSQSVAVLPKP